MRAQIEDYIKANYEPERQERLIQALTIYGDELLEGDVQHETK